MVGEWEAQDKQLVIAAQWDSWGCGTVLDGVYLIQLTTEYFNVTRVLVGSDLGQLMAAQSDEYAEAAVLTILGRVVDYALLSM